MKTYQALTTLALAALIGIGGSAVFAGSVETGGNVENTTVVVRNKNVDVFFGTIRMTGASNSVEQYAALSSIAPTALLNHLISVAPTGSRLREHLQALANDGSNPTINEFATASGANEIAFSLNGGNISTISPFRGNIRNIAEIEARTIGNRVAQVSQTGPQHRGDFSVVLDGGTVSTTSTVNVGSFQFSSETNSVRTDVVASGSFYANSGDIYVSPIVLDLSGKGKLEASKGEYLPHPGKMDKSSMIVFDYFNNGFPIAMEWVGPNDGLLVEPKADGTVDGSCLFSLTGGYSNGYEEMSLRDENSDKVLKGEELKGLSVWQDKNRNGKSDEGELSTVESLNITEVSLKHQAFKSSFVMNGKTHTMWDWWPSAMEIKAYDVAEIQEQVKY